MTNLNAICRITLTATGARIWNARYDAIPQIPKPDPVAAGAVVETELWNVMNYFGPHIYMGMAEVPFHNNQMEILPCA